MKRVFLALLIIIGGLLGVYYFGSGTVAEQAARNWLDSQHIAYKDLSIRTANLRSAGIKSGTFGTGDNISVKNATIDYRIKGANATFERIRAESVTLDTKNAKGAWDLGGLESFAGLPAFAPTDDAAHLRISGTLLAENGATGLQANLDNGKLSYTKGTLNVSGDITHASIKPSEEADTFDLAIEATNIVVKNGDEIVTAPLSVNATGTMKGDVTKGQGTLSDMAKKIPFIVSGQYDGKAKKGGLQWSTNAIALAEGGLQPSVLSPLLESLPPLNANLKLEGNAQIVGDAPLKLSQNFIIARAALSPLLKLVFKDDISVTGDLTGTIPITWSGEEIPQIKGARLTAPSPGTLIYDPLTGASSALSGNDQSAMLLQALRKFDYTTLTISADSDKQGALKASFNIKGSNKDFYNGKLVDFTLNVTGNLMTLLENQSKIHDIITNQ